jgi:hypothetical protein
MKKINHIINACNEHLIEIVSAEPKIAFLWMFPCVKIRDKKTYEKFSIRL